MVEKAGQALPLARERVEWLDAAKGLAMAAVIWGHCFLHGLPIVYSFNGPLLFVLAGYTIKGDKAFSGLLRSSLTRLMLPALALWVACHACSLLSGVTSLGEIFSWTSLSSLFWGSAIPYSSHPVWGFNVPVLSCKTGPIWFLYALFCARLLFVGILKVSGERHVLRCALTLAVVACGYALSRYCPLPLNLDIAMVICLFLLVGSEMKRLGFPGGFRKLPKGKAVLLLLLLVGCYGWLVWSITTPIDMAVRYYGSSFLALPAGALGSMIAILLCQKLVRCPLLGKILVFAGVNSLLVYAFHTLSFQFPLHRGTGFVFCQFVENPNTLMLELSFLLLNLAFAVGAAWLWVKLRTRIAGTRPAPRNR